MHLPMPAVGRGTAVAVTTSTAPNVRAFVLPAQPPPWAARQIDADGSASGAGLKSARAAESIALSKLREQINALPIGQSTVGEAAKANPRIEQMIADLVRRSPTSKVEYQKGLVKVKVSLDLGLLWGLLRNAQ
jgi:hypothetical protein